MKVEQLFVETLIDIDQKLRSNPSDYDLLKVSSLLRPILLDNPPLLDAASAATSLRAKFRVVKPGPVPPTTRAATRDGCRMGEDPRHSSRSETCRCRRGNPRRSVDGRTKRTRRPGA